MYEAEDTDSAEGKKKNWAWVMDKIEENPSVWCYNRMPKVAGRSGSVDKSRCLCLPDSFSHGDVQKGTVGINQEL